ncbi:MAG: hypothetical protein Q8P89_01315 [bacterium]|nr:hypothetical protein [bacterium]
MTGSVQERRWRGGWVVGRNEAEPFGGFADLTNKLWHAGYHHWQEAFDPKVTDTVLLRSGRRFGMGDIGYLRKFQRDVKDQMRDSLRRPFHAVEILPEGSKRNLVRRPFRVDGCFVVFPDERNNFIINSLLAGRSIKLPEDSSVDGEESRQSLETDLDFLNDYFGLGLALEDNRRMVKIAMPEQTSVVVSPVLDSIL